MWNVVGATSLATVQSRKHMDCLYMRGLSLSLFFTVVLQEYGETCLGQSAKPWGRTES